jgi:two-component system sensor histidine kinase YesM
MNFSTLRKTKFKISYRVLLILISVCMVSIFLVYLGTEYYSSIEKYISEKVISINRSNLYQKGNYVDVQLNQMKALTEIIASNTNFLQKINDYDSSNYSDKRALRENITKGLHRSAKINSNIHAITILTKDNMISVGNLPIYNLTQQDLKYVQDFNKTIASADGSAVFIVPSRIKIYSDAPEQLNNLFERYSFSTNLIYDGNIIGTLFLSSNDNLFEFLLKESKGMVVFDKHGGVIHNNTGKEDSIVNSMYKEILEESEKSLSSQNIGNMLLYTSSNFSGVSIGYLFDKQEQIKKTNMVKVFFLTFFIILIIVVLALSGALTRFLTRPINQLVSNITEYDFLKKDNKTRLPIINSSKITLRESILIFFIGIVLFSATTLIVSTYFLFSNIIEDYVSEATRNAFNQTVENLNFYLNNARNVSTNIAYDDTIYDYLNLNYLISDESIASESLENIASKNHPLYNGKTEINIYNRLGSSIVSFLPVVCPIPFDNNNDGTFFHSSNYIFKNTRKGEDGVYYIPFWMKIRNVLSYDTIGYFECRLNELDIEKIYNNLNNDYGEVFIIDKFNTIISHSNKNLIGTKINLDDLENNGKNRYLFMKANLSSTNWTIIASYQDSIVKVDKANFLLSEINLFIITILITIVVAFLLSRNLSRYFRILLNRINSVNFKNLYKEFPQNSGINEIDQLGAAFNDMAIRIENLLDEVIISTKKTSELEKIKNQAEFVSLQAQIKPHFLYNTFESINWMIRKDNKSDAIFMINCLSSILRFVAKKDDIQVSVGSEVGYAKTYVEIMKVRYQDELSVEFDIDEKLYEYNTIKLILQPLIENAIYHGLKPKNKPGNIFVYGRLLGSIIEFEVTDDGVGMDSETLDDLKKKLTTSSTPDRIGLQNVQTRITLFYGKKYGLNITSELNVGTTVSIRIPRQHE